MTTASKRQEARQQKPRSKIKDFVAGVIKEAKR
jgi:hypothetical protein